MTPFEAAYSEELTKQAGGFGGVAESTAGGFGRLAGKLFNTEMEAGHAMSYSLKLPADAGKVTKVFHFGVAPAMLAANAYADVKAINSAANIDPADLIAAGLSPAEADRAKRESHGAAVGRAIGDAAGWATYPLTLSNPLLHHGVQLGANLGLPVLGEHLGKNLA